MPRIRRELPVFLTALAVWFVVIGQLSWSQLVAGVVAASVTTALVHRDLRAAEVVVRAPEGWWRTVGGLVGSTLRDVWTVSVALSKRVRGTPPDSGYATVSVPDDPARLAMGIWAVTVTPNTVAVGYDPRAGVLLIHQLELAEDPAADVVARFG